MKKLISYLVLFAFMTSNVFASNEASLQTIMDDFNYALTVEWDQEDAEFYAGQVQNLRSNIEKQGFTNDEIMEFVMARIKDPKAQAEVSEVYEMTKSKMIGSAEAELMIKDIMNKSYATGANFNGRATWKIIGVGLLGAALMVALALQTDTYIN